MGDQANETTTHEPLAVSHNYNDNTNHTTNNSHNEFRQTTYVPLGSKSAHAVMNSPRWCDPRMEESLRTIRLN